MFHDILIYTICDILIYVTLLIHVTFLYILRYYSCDILIYFTLLIHSCKRRKKWMSPVTSIHASRHTKVSAMFSEGDPAQEGQTRTYVTALLHSCQRRNEWTSHLTYLKTSCHTYVFVMFFWGGAEHKGKKREGECVVPHEWVMSRISICHIYESCLEFECIYAIYKSSQSRDDSVLMSWFVS